MVKNSEIIFVIEEAVEGGYTARALGASIFTEGETIAEVKTNVKEAINCHFDDDEMPKRDPSV
jgi:predicted RNase H-like HicB family nuclease